jgi:hypothetical protein
MAAAVVASSIFIDSTQKMFLVYGLISLTGNYGTSGGAYPHGDLLDLSGLGVPSNEQPVVFFAEYSPVGALSSGKRFQYMSGAGQGDGQIQVRNADGTEYTPGSAYGTPPFAITGFALAFVAAFPSFNIP